MPSATTVNEKHNVQLTSRTERSMAKTRKTTVKLSTLQAGALFLLPESQRKGKLLKDPRPFGAYVRLFSTAKEIEQGLSKYYDQTIASGIDVVVLPVTAPLRAG